MDGALDQPGILFQLGQTGDGTVVPGRVKNFHVAVQHVPALVVIDFGHRMTPDLLDPRLQAGCFPKRLEPGRGMPADTIAVAVHRPDRME